MRTTQHEKQNKKQHKAIGLVRTEDGELCFVWWNRPATIEGRRVRLDETDKVITVIPYMVPVEKFGNAEVIINAVGFPMMRRAKAFRPPMPRWCLLQRFQVQVNDYPGPWMQQSLPRIRNKCIVCDSAGRDTIKKDQLDRIKSIDDAEFVVCQKCLSPWHSQCAAMVCIAGGALPVVGQRWLCKLCKGAGAS